MHFLLAINSDISVLIVCNTTGGTMKGDIKKKNQRICDITQSKLATNKNSYVCCRSKFFKKTSLASINIVLLLHKCLQGVWGVTQGNLSGLLILGSFQNFAVFRMQSVFFWEFPRRPKYKSRRFGTDIEFRNVGYYTSDAGEIPKRTQTTNQISYSCSKKLGFCLALKEFTTHYSTHLNLRTETQTGTLQTSTRKISSSKMGQVNEYPVGIFAVLNSAKVESR